MSEAVELLFSVTVRVSVLFLLAWGAAWLLRRRSATIRHLIWTSAAVGALVLLAAAPFAPEVHTTRLPVWQNCSVQVSPVHIELPSCGDRTSAARAAPAAGTRTGGPASAGATAGGAAAATSSAERAPAAEEGSGALLSPALAAWNPSLASVLVAVWAAGATIVLLTLLLERLWVRRMRSSSRGSAERDLVAEARELARGLGLSERVDIRLSPESVPPLSWGLWRARILLPEDALEWPAEQRRAVLLHELGHARRRDVFTQTLAALACAVFWFHPLVWMAAGRMKDERERACDDLVLHSGVGSTRYARYLVDLARRLSPSSRSRLAVVGMTRGPDLAERVDRLVSRADPGGPPGRRTTLVSVLAAVAVIGGLAPHVIAEPDCQGGEVASRPAYGTTVPVERLTPWGADR